MSRYVWFLCVSTIASLAGVPDAQANCLTSFSCQIGGECRLPCFDSTPVATPVELHQPAAAASPDTGSAPPRDTAPPPPMEPAQATPAQDARAILPPLRPRQKSRVVRHAAIAPKRPIVLAAKRREIAKLSPLNLAPLIKTDPRAQVSALPTKSVGFVMPVRPPLTIVAAPQINAPPQITATAQINAHVDMPAIASSPRPVGKLSARIDALPVTAAVAAPVPADRHLATERFKRLSRGLDPNVSIAGVPPAAADILDGPISPADPETPVSTSGPKQKREKAKNALNAKSVSNQKSVLDVAPGDAKIDLFAEPEPPSTPPPKSPPTHPKIFDVSEGTRLDPLKNRSYDLNSAKDIPADLLTKN